MRNGNAERFPGMYMDIIQNLIKTIAQGLKDTRLNFKMRREQSNNPGINRVQGMCIKHIY